jgi:hypothetical protein
MTKAERRKLFKKGVADGASHLLIVYNTDTDKSFAVYVADGQVEAAYRRHSMNLHQVDEIFKMSDDMENQLELDRCFNY